MEQQGERRRLGTGGEGMRVRVADGVLQREGWLLASSLTSLASSHPPPLTHWQAVALMGSLIMPHNIYLHSALVQVGAGAGGGWAE